MSDAKTLSPEAAKILQARRDAVAELKARDGAERGVHDPHVTRLAFARMYQATVMVQMAAGEHVSASDYAAADAAVENALAAVPAPLPKFELQIVDSVDRAPVIDGVRTGVSGYVGCLNCRWQPPEGESWPRCLRCGWKDGMDTARMPPWPPEDDGGGVGDGGGNGAAGGGAVEPVPEPAAARGHGHRFAFGPVRRAAELGLKNKPSVPAPAPESRGLKNKPQVAQAPRKKTNAELHKQFHEGGMLRSDQSVAGDGSGGAVIWCTPKGAAPGYHYVKWDNPVRHRGPYGV